MKQFSWFKPNTFHPSYKTDKYNYLLILLSHLVNIVPITIGIILGLPIWYMSIMILQLIFSILYHIYFNSIFLKISDFVFASLLIISNIIIFFTHSVSYTRLILLIILIIISFMHFFDKRNYTYNHSIWHIFAAIITSIVEL